MLTLREKHRYESEIAQLKFDLARIKGDASKVTKLTKSLWHYKKRCKKLELELIEKSLDSKLV